MGSEQVIKKILSLADVSINGNRPWDIKVNDKKLYGRILSGGSLALGESYMDGWWDCKSIDQFIYKVLKAKLNKRILSVKHLALMIFSFLKARIINLQSKSRAFEIGKKHYDLGNELYKNMLDKRLMYSCGYWKNARNLNEAQEAKIDLICRKLKLKKGMALLDIGCGWGGLAKYAAEKYKVKVIGITVSKEQAEFANKACKNLPVKIILDDYRKLLSQRYLKAFDRIVSVGMFEHVGPKNYRNFMKIAHYCLKDKGIFLLHTIGGNKSVRKGEQWTSKYIFPNSVLPSAKQIAKASEGVFVLEDWHNFGSDYDPTLMAWYSNFTKNWNKIKMSGKYDERFYRMWVYYLLSCAGSFRVRNVQLWQIVFSKNLYDKYESVR